MTKPRFHYIRIWKSWKMSSTVAQSLGYFSTVFCIWQHCSLIKRIVHKHTQTYSSPCRPLMLLFIFLKCYLLPGIEGYFSFGLVTSPPIHLKMFLKSFLSKVKKWLIMRTNKNVEPMIWCVWVNTFVAENLWWYNVPLYPL